MADQPSLETIPGSFVGLEQAFRPERAATVDKTIQFDFSGREAGTWTLVVNHGTVAYHEGAATNPGTTVTVDSDNWLAILKGTLNPMSAVLGGKLKLTGDMAVMMQFQTWFERTQS
jgi:putative sterol carrier protein